MNDVATLIADMVRAGVDPEIIGRTAAALSAREPVMVVDEQAERRRAKDRERKRLRNSAESSESAEALSPKKESPQTPKEKTTPNRERETRDQQFETVWAVYPRKSGKAPARKAFDAALKIADFPTILAGAERYAASRAGQDIQFTKHATTWFHGQHWADAAEPVHQPQQRSTAPPKKVTVASMWRDEGRKLGILPNEPPHELNGRLDASHGDRPAPSSNLARRIASS